MVRNQTPDKYEWRMSSDGQPSVGGLGVERMAMRHSLPNPVLRNFYVERNKCHSRNPK